MKVIEQREHSIVIELENGRKFLLMELSNNKGLRIHDAESKDFIIKQSGIEITFDK
jgi:hypothetical protein